MRANRALAVKTGNAALQMLASNCEPRPAFLIECLPVLPAGLRPPGGLDCDPAQGSTLNLLYADLIRHNNQLRCRLELGLPEPGGARLAGHGLEPGEPKGKNGTGNAQRHRCPRPSFDHPPDQHAGSKN